MTPPSDYNRQQADALLLVRGHLAVLPPRAADRLRQSIGPYLDFRDRVARFQSGAVAEACSRRCFSHGSCACCGREGILTFFADVVVNVLLSSDEEIERLLEILARDRGGDQCVYVGESGCRWRLKPIVCEMFLCDVARERLLGEGTALAEQWERLRQEEWRYTRPSQPVLFDEVERHFIEAGLESPLMYCHRSPGLLRLKAKHGVGVPVASRERALDSPGGRDNNDPALRSGAGRTEEGGNRE